jgi:hypothetical protein
MPYFAMLRSTGSGFAGVRRFDRDLPGWGAMTPGDRFMVADFDGDGRDDILVFNGTDFAIGYLLMLRSTGNGLQFVRRFDDTLPGWGAMKANDTFFVANFNGGAGWDDLLVYNDAWFGLLRSLSSRVMLTSIYPQWIHNHRYHGAGWW